MKNKILITLIVLMTFVVCFTSINVYAEETQVLINYDPATFHITVSNGINWRDYITENPEQGFTFTNSYVYFNGKRLMYDAGDGVILVNPDRYVIEFLKYDCEDCEHSYKLILQSGSYPCQKMYRYWRCTKCEYQYTEEFEASAEHQFGLELSTYISPTCSSPGYERYVCSACGAYDSSKETAIDPLAHIFLGGSCIAPAVCRECGIEGDESQYRHNWQEATCTEPEYCLDCKKLGDDSALGHDINWAGSCVRDGCHHNEYFNNIKSSAVIVWDNVSASASNAFESVKGFFVGDENSEGLLDGAKNVFNVGIMIISVIVLIVIIYAVVRLAILIINVIKGLKISNARNKRRKKRKKRKEKVRSE